MPRPHAPAPWLVAPSRGAVVSVLRTPCRFGRCWIIERLDRLDIVDGIPPLPVAILPHTDQPAFFESFQSTGADPHLLSRLGNAHMFSCSGASPLFPGHLRPCPVTCCPPSRTPHASASETPAVVGW